MKAVPTRVPWAVALLVLLPSAADPLAAAPCRQFNTSDLPLLGGLGGAWLSSSRVALTDVKEHQFLVYDVGQDTVRAVEPTAEGHNPQQVLGLAAVRGGFVMAGVHRDRSRYREGSSVLRLDLNLKPVTTYSWPQEWGDDTHFHAEGSGRPTLVQEIEGIQDGFVAWLFFANREGIMRFALPAGEGDVVTQTGFWPQMPTEAHARVPLFPSRLATTVGENAAAYALRVGERPFIQRLAARGRSGVEWQSAGGP